MQPPLETWQVCKDPITRNMLLLHNYPQEDHVRVEIKLEPNVEAYGKRLEFVAQLGWVVF